MLSKQYTNIRLWVSIILSSLMLFGCNTQNAESKQKSDPPHLYEGMSLGSLLNEPMQLQTRADIKQALTKPWYGAFKVRPSAENSVEEYTLKSCNDYFQHKPKKVVTVKPFEASPFAEFVIMCELAQSILSAKPAKQSYIQLKVDQRLPKQLPKAVAQIVSTSEAQRIQADPGYTSWADVNKVTQINVQNEAKATYLYEHGQTEVELLAKADFDHDGYEDIAILFRDSLKGGSYVALRAYLLTKTEPEGLYKINMQLGRE